MEPGWQVDPSGRFEYRYFNGVQWTSDVAVNGQRYVDSPDAPGVGRRPPRGMAITSFVTGLSAVLLGWVPFIFVIAVGAAIAAIVFGILGLSSARRHDGYGRGFAVTGLVLAPVALLVCVGGFFFTKAVVRELRDFIEPGPHQLVVDQPCKVEQGRATATGTIRNLDDRNHDYRIVVEFTGDDDTDRATARLFDVAPDATSSWSASTSMSTNAVTCEVIDVFGPLPFDIDTKG